MDGHPNAYDRFWFNGYTEEFYFAVALGLYPNRGVIDGAFSVVHGDEQFSVFASDALRGRPTARRSAARRHRRAPARQPDPRRRARAGARAATSPTRQRTVDDARSPARPCTTVRGSSWT